VTAEDFTPVGFLSELETLRSHREIAAVTLPLKLVLRASTTHEQSPTVPTEEGAVR
jgi:hypothetical protein